MLDNHLQQTTSADDIFRCIFFLALYGLITAGMSHFLLKPIILIQILKTVRKSQASEILKNVCLIFSQHSNTQDFLVFMKFASKCEFLKYLTFEIQFLMNILHSPLSR